MVRTKRSSLSQRMTVDKHLLLKSGLTKLPFLISLPRTQLNGGTPSLPSSAIIMFISTVSGSI